MYYKQQRINPGFFSYFSNNSGEQINKYIWHQTNSKLL